MKKLLLVFITNLIFFSCEDVVEIPLNDSKEILIVDAYINWIKETNKTTYWSYLAVGALNHVLRAPNLRKQIPIDVGKQYMIAVEAPWAERSGQ